MSGASVTIRHQLEILREIRRQQSQDIDVRAAECEWLEECLRQRRADASVLQTPSAKPEIDSLIERVREEVDRLHCEVGVWRGAPLDSAVLTQRSDYRIDRQEEATHELERQRWHAEKKRLERQVREVQDRVRQLEAGHALGRRTEFVDMASMRAEADFFRDELAAERLAASISLDRVSAVRAEVEEEKRLQARTVTQAGQALITAQQEIGLTERRIEVEMELQRAQQAQLQSVQSTAMTLKAQVQRARQETNELKASLEQNQDTLRRLGR